MMDSETKWTWRDYLGPHVVVPAALIVALLLFLTWALLPDGIYDYAPDFLLPKNPLREPVFDAQPIYIKGYELTPMRFYKLDARLLGKHEYSLSEDAAADLAPFDIYLGWGPMADANVLNYLSIQIYQRVANAVSRSIPELHISMNELRLYSDNNHLIPASPEIGQRLEAAPIGSLVHLEGYLVDVRAGYGFRWTSSLSYGWSSGIIRPYKVIQGCKVIYVTKFDVTQRP